MLIERASSLSFSKSLYAVGQEHVLYTATNHLSVSTYFVFAIARPAAMKPIAIDGRYVDQDKLKKKYAEKFNRKLSIRASTPETPFSLSQLTTFNTTKGQKIVFDVRDGEEWTDVSRLQIP